MSRGQSGNQQPIEVTMLESIVTDDESGLAMEISRSCLVPPSIKSTASSPTMISTDSDALSTASGAGLWSIDSSVDLNHMEVVRRQRAVSVDTSLGTGDRSSTAPLNDNSFDTNKAEDARRNFAGLAVNRFNELTEYMFMCTSISTVARDDVPRSASAVRKGMRLVHVPHSSPGAAVIESMSMEYCEEEAGMEIGEDELLRPAYDLYRV